MKKMLILALALLIAMMPCFSALAEEDVSEQYFEGFWADPAFDRMELVILPSEVTWSDERMGEEASVQKYVVIMSWPSSDSETTVYHIVGTLDETGRILSYEGGLLGEFISDENGEPDEEDTGLLDDSGTGAFTMREDGTLLWQDSALKETAEMVLRRETVPVPTPEEIREGYYRLLAGLEPGSAGASLKLAKAVAEVYRFCGGHPFWAMDTEAFAVNLLAAQEFLSEEEKAVFTQNRGALTEEAVRLLDETEELGSAYADAGVEELMDELRNDPSVRLSVETFIFAVETLNEEP